MKNSLQSPWEGRLNALSQTGLTYAGIVFVESFMLAQHEGRGKNNRAVLLERIRMATDTQKRAAILLFDDFCKAKGL
jgi:hypothetical protein